MWLPATPSKLSNPHAMLQLLPKPCYIALFHEATIEPPVALAARGRNYRAAKQEGEKKKSGRSKGGGRREPRPRLHPRRPAFTGRPPCLQSKDNGITVERTLLRSCNVVALSAITVPTIRLPNPTCYGPLRNKPATSDMTNSTRNMKNNTFAISAAPAAMPPNPNTAAISATTKNTSA